MRQTQGLERGQRREREPKTSKAASGHTLRPFALVCVLALTSWSTVGCKSNREASAPQPPVTSADAPNPSSKQEKSPMSESAFHALTVDTIDGDALSLSAYKGQVLLVVNTASECGFTPQYAGLEELYGANKDRGFQVLGFPSNDFGGQEPGSDAEIKSFCTKKFSVSFPMFSR